MELGYGLTMDISLQFHVLQDGGEYDVAGGGHDGAAGVAAIGGGGGGASYDDPSNWCGEGLWESES